VNLIYKKNKKKKLCFSLMEILQELLQEIFQDNANRAIEQTIEKGQWQWKSNTDSWSKSEEPHWKSYSLEQNYLLEKAFYSQQKEVELGDYIISIEHRIQTKKGSIAAQRPIRRIAQKGEEEEEEMNIRCERYFETELAKTINKVFGGLEDFVSFFSKRSAEIFNFAEQFTTFEGSNNIDGLNEVIIPVLLASIRREREKSHSKDSHEQSLSSYQKKQKIKIEKLEEELILSFEKGFSSFQEFYEQILRVYTMDTFLYKSLNIYLRNENWNEINDLLPYAFCLCKAFFYSKQDSNIDANLTSKKPASLFLYRGAALDELALSYYDVKQTQLFGWNSATSTTRELTIANNFMFRNADLQNKRFPVLFIIEVPIGENNSDDLRLIAMEKYSTFPEEGEVIFAPGSVFELQEVSKDKDEITTIKIKLKGDLETLAHQGMIMPGTLQKEMMSPRETKLMCLEGEELMENLKHISGNKLIQEIEFCLCKFDNKSLKAVLRTLPTLEYVKGLKFISCYFNDDKKKLKEKLNNQKSLEIKRLEVVDTSNFSEILWKQIDECQSWQGLEVLEMNFLGSEKMLITDKHLSDFCSQALQHLKKLKSLSLDLKGNSKITDNGIYNLSRRGLRRLSGLTSLNLNLRRYPTTDKVVYSLSSQGLKMLTQLVSLNINFQNWTLTNEAINYLCCQGLRNMKKLTDLKLSFECCYQINGSGLYSLSSEGFKYLDQLTSLSLNFSSCGRFGSWDLSYFGSQWLKNLTQLRSFDLDFSNCYWIGDKGIESICFQGIQNLVCLRSLKLNFEGCSVTNKGLESLCIYGLKNLNQLSALSLNFSNCSEITDEGIH